ncbi:F-box domain-containing protein [Mycena sanguinolenta]|uniref:F-box domain-containing protein n=1 Tax=Mycena sanguinolenta TaxID=230812 RepID=A0A8H6ZCF3_9AGAR|nr:F-box domain-containing protein [Mycena sanguinolenta]
MSLFEIQNPRIRARLRYNILPSDLEKSTIQDSIHIAQLRLAEVEAQDRTDDSAAALRRYISEYSSLLAPIRRLSVEVLQLILIHPDIHGWEWIGSDRVTLYRTEAIGGVSHRWREVTRATPILWSSFQIPLHRRNLYDLQHLFRPTRIRLKLSKNAPLSITFAPSKDDFPGDENVNKPLQHARAVAKITAELLLHAERWSHITLPLDHEFLALLSSAQGRLPWLESLGFVGSVRNKDELEKNLKIFEAAPKLRSLALSNGRSLESLSALPWSQLTRITALHEFGFATEKLLKQSPELQRIVLYNRPDPSSNSNHAQISPKLRTVVFNGAQSTHDPIMTAFASMETPELEEIYLLNCWAWNPSSIPSLLKQSNCSLATLVLEQCRIRPAELLAFFPAIRTLQTLVLVDNAGNTVSNLVLDGLTPTPDVVLLPMLHTFVLRGSYLCSTDRLLMLLESRMRSQQCPIINVNIGLRDRELLASHLDRIAALPGKVAVTHLPPVWSICTGSPWQSAAYLDLMPELLEATP